MTSLRKVATPMDPFYSSSDPSRLISMHSLSLSLSGGGNVNINLQGKWMTKDVNAGPDWTGFSCTPRLIKGKSTFQRTEKRYSGAGWRCVEVLWLYCQDCPKATEKFPWGGTAGFRGMRVGVEAEGLALIGGERGPVALEVRGMLPLVEPELLLSVSMLPSLWSSAAFKTRTHTHTHTHTQRKMKQITTLNKSHTVRQDRCSAWSH